MKPFRQCESTPSTRCDFSLARELIFDQINRLSAVIFGLFCPDFTTQNISAQSPQIIDHLYRFSPTQ